MIFLWPMMLFLLLLVPIIVFLYLRLQWRRRRMASTYGNLGMVQDSKGRQIGFRRHIPPLLFLLGLVILFVALARPQTMVSLPKEEGTIILTFDVSGSMAATDIKPTRMEAAKAAARNFVQKQPLTVDIGVVAFSDSGFSVQTPTNIRDTVLAAIDRLTPQRGTSIANGILISLNAIAGGTGLPSEVYSNLLLTPTPTPTPVAPGTYTNAVIILLTDGENNEFPDPAVAAQAAANRGVRIYTVGLGSPGGTNLHINGFTVHTQLDEATLQGIAQVTGGSYYNAESAQDLQNVYDKLTPKLVIKPEETEVTSIFAGASIFLFLIGGMFSLFWFSRLP